MKLVHPKLGRVATPWRKDKSLYNIYDAQEIAQCVFNTYENEDLASLNNCRITKDQLLAMGFEEVEEEHTPEWIEKAFEMYYEGETIYAFKEHKAADKRLFVESILKHYPKQDTISVEDLQKNIKVSVDHANSVGDGVARVVSVEMGGGTVILDRFTYNDMKLADIDDVIIKVKAIHEAVIQTPELGRGVMWLRLENILRTYAIKDTTLVPLDVEGIAENIALAFESAGDKVSIYEIVEQQLSKYGTPKE